MGWQEIVAGLSVVIAVAYLVWRMRRRPPRPSSDAPDVPVERLLQKRSERHSCEHRAKWLD